ncbi:MAG: S-methyl-5'-thioadenosine phosphorylase [Bdellovibrionales bacterium]|nr:S-methyl-5'-thioadenosine phosphorylase [Bdellovibrionales bacterium]
MKIGVIGGSGLYRLTEDGPEPEKLEVSTPFGETSGPLYKQTVADKTVFFLARHGAGHRILPSEINYRANVYALKKMGVSAIISVSAVGSMKKEIQPGQFVLPDQYIDLTKGKRDPSFFGEGVVAHAHFADPTCSALREALIAAANTQSIKCHAKGTYVCIEGPQFSTRAESMLYRSWGVDVIGMTALPEARLAKEAGISYQTVAMATDYDCWNTEGGDVTVEAILKVLSDNVASSRKLVFELLSQKLPDFESINRGQMASCVVTPKEMWPAARREVLETILS